MTQTTHPPKEMVGEHMRRRAQERTPPPTPEQIRRELDRGSLANNDPRKVVVRYQRRASIEPEPAGILVLAGLHPDQLLRWQLASRLLAGACACRNR
jgi:hypothetical protein